MNTIEDGVTYRTKWVQDGKEIPAVSANSDGTPKTPTASKPIVVSLMKSEGGNTEAVAHGTGTLTLHVGVASYSHTFTDANFTYTLQMTGSSESAEKNATNFRAVWVLDSTTYEHTINKVYDGADGDDAVSYQIIVDSVSAMVNAGVFEMSLVCHCLKSVGSTRSTATDGSMTAYVGSALIGTSISWDSTTGGTYTKSNYTDDWETMGSPTSVVISYWISNNIVATLSVPITVNGDMGRNPYYLGEWSDSDDPDYIATSTHIVATNTTAPYVKITDTDSKGNKTSIYKIWVGDSIDKAKSELTQDEIPTTANTPYWEVMTADFKYLITKATFADFAKLGSSIFNKDFMYSQWLVKYNPSTGSYDTTNDYTRFSPNFTDDSVLTLNGFAPISTSYWRAGVLYLANGCTYHFSTRGRIVSGNGTLSVTLERTDTTSSQVIASFTSSSYSNVEFDFSCTASATYCIRARIVTGSAIGEIGYINASCDYPYIPATMFNWYNGSGSLACGNIRWNTQGDIRMRNALIGGFIYNEPNELPPIETVFNVFIRSDYMNSYMQGYPQGTCENTPTLKFPECGANININNDWDWDSYTTYKPALVLPFFYNPITQLGTHSSPYGQVLDPMSGLNHSEYLDNLEQYPLKSSFSYVGSTVTITNDAGDSTSYIEVYGVKGYGEVMKNDLGGGAGAYRYTYIIREYDPWGWCAYNWIVLTGLQIFSRSDIVSTILKYRTNFLVQNAGRIYYNTTSGLTVNGEIGGVSAKIRFCNNDYDATNPYSYAPTTNYLPFEVRRNGFAILKCVSDDGIVYWNIEDYFTT